MASYYTIGKFNRLSRECASTRWAVVCIVLILFSVNTSFGQKTDSLLINIQHIKLDSLQKLNADSLQLKNKLDSVSSRLNNSIDSLSSLHLPRDQYYGKLDTLLKSTQARLNARLKYSTDSLNARSNEIMNRYQAKLESKKQRLDSLNKKYKLGMNLQQPDADISVGELKMAKVGTPEFDQPEGQGHNIPASNFPKLDVPEVENVKEKLGEVNDLTSEAKEYSEKVGELKKTDVKEEAKKLPGEIEKQAENIDQVEALKKELPQTNTVTDQVEDLKSKADPANLKNDAKTRTKKAFVDHFAGKDEAVKSGISQLEKYQKKYNSLADIRHLPKKRPNEMKGKPFIERLTPGITFQVYMLESNWKGIDISPSVEYWFSDRFRAGFSAGYRINVNTKSFELEDRDQVYMFRSLAHYKLGKGFFAHLDAEALRTKEYLVTKPPQPTDFNSRAWDYSLNVGIFKSYHISKHVRGTMVVLYDLTQIGETFNVSQIGMRFGVEYKLTKKKKEPSSGK
jgi:hypothetical protein